MWCTHGELLDVPKSKQGNTTNLNINNHIYSKLFKTQERESDRRSKVIEQRKESQKTKNKKKNKDM